MSFNLIYTSTNFVCMGSPMDWNSTHYYKKYSYNDKRLTTHNNFMIEKNICPKKCGVLISKFEKGQYNASIRVYICRLKSPCYISPLTPFIRDRLEKNYKPIYILHSSMKQLHNNGSSYSSINQNFTETSYLIKASSFSTQSVLS